MECKVSSFSYVESLRWITQALLRQSPCALINSVEATQLKAKVARKLREGKKPGLRPTETTQALKNRLKCAARVGGRLAPRGGGGYSHTVTYTGMCRPTGSWFWNSWLRTGYPFQRRFLERGIIFWTHESSSFVSSHLKLVKDRLLLKIRFNALTSKMLYSLHPRTEYKKFAHF